MINGISASLSGLMSLQTKNESIANNVANIETDEFKKTRVTMKDETPQGVSTNISRINTPGPLVHEQTPDGEALVEKSNVELTEEIPQQLMTRRYFQANIKTVQAYDEMLGNLLDIKS
ncbi:MAG: flagellar biosynthesis protein FlgC [Desulfobulbaceae bacterium]|nr:flagellar biosynthesis protein FlgC [Desulfobulbaceae bacterium]